MVVADRATRGKGIAEPEAVLFGDAVGIVGKTGSALVSGNHQIRVVFVMANEVWWRHNLTANQIVGEVEQSAQEGVITSDAFFQYGIPVAARRRVLDDETTLGTDWHDHRILDHLGLHQAENLGAEIFHAVGPAQAATRDLAAAQMNAFDQRRINKDFPHRLRFGQSRYALRVDLDRVVRLRGIVLALEIIAAHGGENGGEELAQDAVIVQIGHVVQRLQDLRFKRTGLCRVVEVALRVKASEEEFEQLAGDAGMGCQRLFNVGLAECETGLPQILGIGTQDGNFSPVELGGKNQSVEVVTLGSTGQHMTEGVLKKTADSIDIQFFGPLENQAKIMQPYGWPVRTLDFIRTLFKNPDAHVFEHGQRCREGDWCGVTQYLETQAAGRCFERYIEAHRQAARVT